MSWSKMMLVEVQGMSLGEGWLAAVGSATNNRRLRAVVPDYCSTVRCDLVCGVRKGFTGADEGICANAIVSWALSLRQKTLSMRCRVVESLIEQWWLSTTTKSSGKVALSDQSDPSLVFWGACCLAEWLKGAWSCLIAVFPVKCIHVPALRQPRLCLPLELALEKPREARE